MKASPLKLLRTFAPIFAWFYVLYALLIVAGQRVLIPYLFGAKPGVTVIPVSLLAIPLLTAALFTLCCCAMPRVTGRWPEVLGIALSAGPLTLLRLLLVHIESTMLAEIGSRSVSAFTYLNTALRYADFVNTLASALFLTACGMSLAQKRARRENMRE